MPDSLEIHGETGQRGSNKRVPKQREWVFLTVVLYRVLIPIKGRRSRQGKVPSSLSYYSEETIQQ